MIITEARLKQIIREEIELRIVKETISEVVSELQLNLTEEQRLILEKTLLDQIKSAARKAAVPIGVMAALALHCDMTFTSKSIGRDESDMCLGASTAY